ncbi:MAG TPA: C40 family peptidase [Vicinamibacterales bacterium]|nr:C40 family peptidase [Vicinamibacterales bacterium]
MRRFLIVLVAAGSAACASTGAVPQPFPIPAGSPAPAPSEQPLESPAPPPPTRADGYEISGAALSLRGVPYRNGGRDPSGFDCSGFVWYVFDQHGVRVPRTVSEQFQAGIEVDPRDLRAGDLVFFDTIHNGVRQLATHVGIVIGGDEFVHAPSSTGEVRVERLASGYWSPRFIGARRVQ